MNSSSRSDELDCLSYFFLTELINWFKLVFEDVFGLIKWSELFIELTDTREPMTD